MPTKKSAKKLIKQSKIFKKIPAAHLFTTVGIAAIIEGGLLAAFSSSQPSTLTMWASAYLVLVVGILQVFIGFALNKLVRRDVRQPLVWGVVLFNLGNILVIYSTAIKYIADISLPYVLGAGGLILLIAITFLLNTIKNAKSSWQRNLFCVVSTIFAVSVPIGLFLYQG